MRESEQVPSGGWSGQGLRGRQQQARTIGSRGYGAYVDVPWPGEYFFLCPEILALQAQTGQLIDPQTNAFFAGPALDALEDFAASCRTRATKQPASWEQRVGKEWPSGDALYRRASQAEVLTFLDRLTLAVLAAREADKGVFVLGE